MATGKLRNGRPLTEELVEDLAHEAEAGYDLATIHPRRAGRPSLGEGTSPRVQYRVDSGTYEALLARARDEGRGVSEIARVALELYLKHGRGVIRQEDIARGEGITSGAFHSTYDSGGGTAEADADEIAIGQEAGGEVNIERGTAASARSGGDDLDASQGTAAGGGSHRQ
jgi:CRISPR-associated endonuclease/helicase Cas3